VEILNPSPVLCLPHTMWLVYRTVAGTSGLDQEKALSLVVPEQMRPITPQDGAHGKRALAALIEFGLVQRDHDGALTAEALGESSEFLRRLRHRIVAVTPESSKDAPVAPDLRSALVWLMRESPLVPLHYSTAQAGMPAGLFTNDTRWNGFRWWSQALGFSRPALDALAKERDQKAKIVPDPTEAVIDAIRRPFGEPLPKEEPLPVGELARHLQGELPVLPGHPSAIYDGMVETAEDEVRALGLALSCAEERGVISMAYQSDPSDVMALPDAQDRGRARYVSTVTVKG